MPPSCTFQVAGCCEHVKGAHSFDDPDSINPCVACWEALKSGWCSPYRAPVLCGHEESEHDPGDGSKEGRHDPTCMSCEQSGNVARYEAGAHPFTAEVAA